MTVTAIYLSMYLGNYVADNNVTVGWGTKSYRKVLDGPGQSIFRSFEELFCSGHMQK